MSGPSINLKSFDFRREREANWRELEDLVDRIEKKRLRSVSAAELARLPILYRAALSSLSVARSISLDSNVVEYLESLVGRAYFVVYGTKRSLRTAIADFFLYRFPAAFRRYFAHTALATLLMLAGAVTAYVMTTADPDNYYLFIDEGMSAGRDPSASTSELRATLYDDGAGADHGAFAGWLFTHNARIGILAFALGFALGLPVYFLLFINGLNLGAFVALFHQRGLAVDLWSWLLPHGVTELTAVVICGGAGLVLAQSLIFPGRYSRLRNLAIQGREAAMFALGAVVMFFVAGLIEGIFRQRVQDLTIRYAVALSTALFWILYFGLVGRRRGRAEKLAEMT